MFAVYAQSISRDDPLSGLVVGERPDPVAPDGWATVTVKAASLNHHDLWSLKGQGLKDEALPMILGCDAAGLDEDGNEVVVHSVISSPDWTGDETVDPKRVDKKVTDVLCKFRDQEPRTATRNRSSTTLPETLAKE